LAVGGSDRYAALVFFGSDGSFVPVFLSLPTSLLPGGHWSPIPL